MIKIASAVANAWIGASVSGTRAKSGAPTASTSAAPQSSFGARTTITLRDPGSISAWDRRTSILRQAAISSGNRSASSEGTSSLPLCRADSTTRISTVNDNTIPITKTSTQCQK